MHPEKFGFCIDFPKICEIFRRQGCRRGGKRAEKWCFWWLKAGKMKFYFTDLQRDTKKMRKK